MKETKPTVAEEILQEHEMVREISRHLELALAEGELGGGLSRGRCIWFIAVWRPLLQI